MYTTYDCIWYNGTLYILPFIFATYSLLPVFLWKWMCAATLQIPIMVYVDGNVMAAGFTSSVPHHAINNAKTINIDVHRCVRDAIISKEIVAANEFKHIHKADFVFPNVLSFCFVFFFVF